MMMGDDDDDDEDVSPDGAELHRDATREQGFLQFSEPEPSRPPTQ